MPILEKFMKRDDLKLSMNGLRVLKSRYLRKNNQGKIIEPPRQMFCRVARHVSRAEEKWSGNMDTDEAEHEFFYIMSELQFLPNSPTLMNAGNTLGQLSACFALPVDDSIDDIPDSVKRLFVTAF